MPIFSSTSSWIRSRTMIQRGSTVVSSCSKAGASSTSNSSGLSPVSRCMRELSRQWYSTALSPSTTSRAISGRTRRQSVLGQIFRDVASPSPRPSFVRRRSGGSRAGGRRSDKKRVPIRSDASSSIARARRDTRATRRAASSQKRFRRRRGLSPLGSRFLAAPLLSLGASVVHGPGFRGLPQSLRERPVPLFRRVPVHGHGAHVRWESPRQSLPEHDVAIARRRGLERPGQQHLEEVRQGPSLYGARREVERVAVVPPRPLRDPRGTRHRLGTMDPPPREVHHVPRSQDDVQHLLAALLHLVVRVIRRAFARQRLPLAERRAHPPLLVPLQLHHEHVHVIVVGREALHSLHDAADCGGLV
ncbi:hypothetical protein ACHAWF_005034 [Thalassiosira exigua]